MDEKTIATLTRPFPEDVLKSRKQKSGQVFTYVPAALVIERLNEAFGHVWSWAVLEWAVQPNDNGSTDVKVQGRLTVRDGEALVTKDAWGGQFVAARSMECQGDMLKAASTDALKKAASLLGIGLHLYSDDVGDVAEPQGQQGQRRQQQGQQKSQGQQKPPATKAQGQQKPDPVQGITAGQTARVTTLARALGLDDERLAAQVAKRFKAQVHQLTRAQADELITAMAKKADGKKAA